jgi:hypothetical protein
MRLVALAAVCLYAAGCGSQLALPTPEPIEIEEERRRQYAEGSVQMLAYWRRAADVTSALRIANAALCGENVRAALGVIAVSAGDLPWLFGRGGYWYEFRDVFEESLSIDGRARVIHVTPEGPADLAGVRAGDVIVSLGGRSVRGGEHLAAVQARERAAEFELGVDRAGTQATLRVSRLAECGYDVGLMASSFPNAFADGFTVYVSTGIVREVSDDDELAIAVGHELAHNSLGHNPDVPSIGYVGAEQEADYLGLYFAARAGYDVSRAPGYWRRLAREYPALVSDDASFTHSGTATRAAALARTVEEIIRKQRAGAPLVPDVTP